MMERHRRDRIEGSITRLARWAVAAPLASILIGVLASLQLGVVFSAPTVSGPARVGALSAGQSSEKPFLHNDHVPRVWFVNDPTKGTPDATLEDAVRQEVARDCRGCHDFGAKDASGKETRAPQSPLDSCFGCHDPKRLDLRAFDAEVDRLRLGSTRQRGFDHLDHGALACRECHKPASDQNYEDFTGTAGLATCNRCHGAEDAPLAFDEVFGQTVDRNKLRTGFSRVLDLELAKADPNPRAFQHEDHLSDGELIQSESCADCHEDVETYDTKALSEIMFTDRSCSKCHIAGGEKPVAIERDLTQSRASVAALTFSHKDHLTGVNRADGLATDAAYDEIASQDCLACHVHETQQRAGDPHSTFYLKKERLGYEGCADCHAGVTQFETQDHGDWSSCTDCHGFGSDDFSQDRPLAPVDRITVGEVRFLLPLQRHPGLGESADTECRKCHVGPMPESPSRIQGVRFEHASHLGANPTAADCAACHSDVSGAKTSDAIGLAWSDGDLDPSRLAGRLSFDMASCSECHKGIEVAPSSIENRARRDVVEFDHSAHLSVMSAVDPKGPMRCTECHDFQAGPSARGIDIGVMDTATSCVQCHGHDVERAVRTAGIDQSRVESCATCHVDRIPAVGEAPMSARARAVLSGAQVHPVGRANCWECHIQRPPTTIEPITAVQSTFNDRKRHAEGISADQSQCMSCHWAIRKQGIKETLTNDPKQRLPYANDLAQYKKGRSPR